MAKGRGKGKRSTQKANKSEEKNGFKGKNNEKSLKNDQNELKHLKFINPGPATNLEDFNPEHSQRHERKLRRLLQQNNKRGSKKAVYDDGGHLISDGRDLCDCLNEACHGCFFPCPQCKSTKCGIICRCSRKWHYDQAEVEGTGGEIRKFPQPQAPTASDQL